jgi:starch synthase (maltosyl-transferring)
MMTAHFNQVSAVSAPSRAVASPEMERLHTARIIIEGVQPQLDGGRYPIKRLVGATLEVQADIFRDGHDLLVAVLKYRPQQQVEWSETPMRCVNPGLDLWVGSFLLNEVAAYTYTIEAWVDVFASWRVELKKKADAAQDVASELLEGARLIRSTAQRLADEPASSPAASKPAEFLTRAAERISKAGSQTEAVSLALDEELAAVMSRHPDRSQSSLMERELQVVVDRRRAQFAAWYEMFPRSQGSSKDRSGTFADCIRRLPEVKRLGFDVIYLPPIHPIGKTHRKGKNNSLIAGPNDPGSPWGIGSETGGHMSIEPSLGTLEDFDGFVAAARELDIEVALDFAIQCSPDHPYVKQHPEWFYHRPDGSIKYAENPPKKYQDIYPLNFDCDAWPSLWEEMRTILLFWIGHGIRTFRVDNPHTKPIRFWEWLIGQIKGEHPDVIFLSEAFTRPKVMKTLAKVGFTQSYTYFTWRNAKAELTEYLTELTQTAMADYYRGNLFANTPDILHEYLQQGGRPAFKIRALLAATLSSLYGIYNGFELCENTPLRPGSEEYLDSEKYEIKPRDWNAPGNINDFLATVNRVRRENPALQRYRNLRFHACDNEQIICYSKATADFSNAVIVVVNLDPYRWQEGYVRLDLAELGLGADQWYAVHDQLTGALWHWHGAHNYVRLDPLREPAHLLVVQR